MSKPNADDFARRLQTERDEDNKERSEAGAVMREEIGRLSRMQIDRIHQNEHRRRARADFKRAD